MTLRGSVPVWRGIGSGLALAGAVQIALNAAVAVMLIASGVTGRKDVELIWLGVTGLGAYYLFVDTGFFVRTYPDSSRARKLGRITLTFQVLTFASEIIAFSLPQHHWSMAVAFMVFCLTMMLIGSAYGALFFQRGQVMRGLD